MNKNVVLSFLLFVLPFSLSAQFGTIGYNFEDPYINFGGLKFAVRLSNKE